MYKKRLPRRFFPLPILPLAFVTYLSTYVDVALGWDHYSTMQACQDQGGNKQAQPNELERTHLGIEQYLEQQSQST